MRWTIPIWGAFVVFALVFHPVNSSAQEPLCPMPEIMPCDPSKECVSWGEEGCENLPGCYQTYVAAEDGTLLNTFVYLPAPENPEGACYGALPKLATILQRNPYGIGDLGFGYDTNDANCPDCCPRDENGNIDPANCGPTNENYWTYITARRTEPRVAPKTGAILRGWKAIVDEGYACVLQDSRGRYASGGIDKVYEDDAGDGATTVEWIAVQPWSDGKVGMAGSSAGGVTAYAAASANPEHLVTIIAQAGSDDIFNDVVYEGNALEIERLLLWISGNTVNASSKIIGLSKSHFQWLIDNGRDATELVRILPEGMVTTNLLHCAETVPPLYDAEELWCQPDPNAPPQWYENPWMRTPLLAESPSDSLLPVGFEPFSLWQPWLDVIMTQPTKNPHRDILNFRPNIDLPVMHITAWYDIFARSVFKSFAELQERRGDQKLYVGPATHFAVYWANFWPEDPFFRWFDYWLKDKPTGIMSEDPVWYCPRDWATSSDYNPNDPQWRYAVSWPLPQTEEVLYYLHSNGDPPTEGILSKDPGSSKDSAKYKYDPNEPNLTFGGRALQLFRAHQGPEDQVYVDYKCKDYETLSDCERRKDVLVFATAELEEDVIVAGNVRLSLRASSNRPDTLFVARLIDVGPELEVRPPEQKLILEGVLRAAYHQSLDTFTPLKPNKKYTFDIELNDIYHVFPAGHKIQLNISSSQFPRWARILNSNNEYFMYDDKVKKAMNVVYEDSVLTIPILVEE